MIDTNEICDSEGCGHEASVAISVQGIEGGEVFLCGPCHEEARPAMEASKSRWLELMSQGCHPRIAERRVRAERTA